MTDIVFKKYNPLSQFDRVKEIWTSLLKKCPHAYYQSWTWREHWIKSLPQDSNLYLITGFKNDLPVIAFFIGGKTKLRAKLLRFHEISLNSTHDPYYDLVWIEYNSMLIDPDVTISLESLIELIPVKWDEFTMTRFSSIYNPNLTFDNKLNNSYNLYITDLKSHYVNLDNVRSNNNDYLALITPKKRYQIRRSMKEYEKIGELKVLVAGSAEEALRIFEDLIELHQKRWTERGQPGTFSNEYYSDFHRKLISTRFEHGEIQLIKISAGNHVLGCLYCFVYEGKVYGYLCGFHYLKGHLYSPGLISHYLAVLYYINTDLNCYDFLEGDYPYKKSLATDYNEMQHIRIEKRNMKYKLWKILTNLKRVYNKARDFIS